MVNVIAGVSSVASRVVLSNPYDITTHAPPEMFP